MDLVIDANVLFSALIKDSTTSDLLFLDTLHLFAPEFLFIEFSKHKDEILNKTQRSPEEFEKLLDILERRIVIIPSNEIISFLEEAEKISPDPDDVVYFALTLKLRCGIWSNDKKLKEQNEVRVYSTEELVRMF